jgi:4-hydroxy 2-oxovalerate aldolase
MDKVKIYDATLRDGNHAVSHQITVNQVAAYAAAAERVGIHYVEVGHGNGLGASSIQVGRSPASTLEMLKVARAYLKNAKLSTFMLPGWGTVRDLQKAVDIGVDVVRIGAHCTEANMTERYIGFLAERKIEVHGILVMSHMATPEQLGHQARLIESYGASAIGIFDSSGYYLPVDVTTRIKAILSSVNIPVIFHAHNNLGMAISNSIAAIEAGAKIIDACARGFGAGAGNTQLEVLVAVLKRLQIETTTDLNGVLDVADLAENELNFKAPYISTESIVSGIAGVFSGFRNQVLKAAKDCNVSSREIFYELGRRRAIAGQEDMIIEVAQKMKNK